MNLIETFIDLFTGQSEGSFTGHSLMSLTDNFPSEIDLSNYSPEHQQKIVGDAIDSFFDDGDISFEGNYDVECRDKAASQLVEDLRRHNILVSSSDFYHEKDMGGVTSYTAKVIKEAINNARLHGSIDNKEFEDLMDQVKKACYNC